MWRPKTLPHTHIQTCRLLLPWFTEASVSPEHHTPLGRTGRMGECFSLQSDQALSAFRQSPPPSPPLAGCVGAGGKPTSPTKELLRPAQLSCELHCEPTSISSCSAFCPPSGYPSGSRVKVIHPLRFIVSLGCIWPWECCVHGGHIPEEEAHTCEQPRGSYLYVEINGVFTT